MSDIVIYTSMMCGYCEAAKELLRRKGVEFEDIDVTADQARRAAMMERSGRRTVPQIFIGDAHIGGFDELYALDRQGELDSLLAAPQPAHRKQR